MDKTFNAILTAAVVASASAVVLAESNATTNNYTVVSEWNTVSSTGYGDGTGDLTSTNGWSNTDNIATVTNGVINVSDDAGTGVLTYTPTTKASATNNVQTVALHFTSVEPGETNAAPENAQAALEVVMDDAGDMSWYGLAGGKMVKLEGHTPKLGAAYDVVVAFSNNENKVRYTVGGVNLYTNNVVWLDNSIATAHPTARVDITGCGAFTNITFSQVGTITAENEGKFAERMQEQKIDPANLNKVAANGNRNWENLALGLTGSVSTSQPVVQPVQSTESSKITLKLGGVDVDTSAVKSVQYRVFASDTPDGAGEQVALKDYKAGETTAEVDLPASGVKYYRMQVIATPNN